jgi:hypothetical protein
MAVELAVGYVSLVPSAKDFGRELTRQLSSQLDDAGQKLGKRLGDDIGDGAGDSREDAGKKAPGRFQTSFLPGITALAGVAGAALATGLLAAFDAGMERTRDNARLAGQLGLSPEEAKRIAGVASDVYTDAWGDSVAEVNDAIRSVDQNLGDVTKLNQKDLKRVTTGALAIADVFDQDVNDVMRSTGQLVRTGLAKDFDEAFDLITYGFQNGMDRSGDFLDTLNEYAEPLASVGLTGEQALGSLNNAIQGGAFNLDKAGDAWKEFSIRSVDGSKLTSDAYATLGLDADEMATAIAQGGPAAQNATSTILTALATMTDPVERERAGVALFGSTWEDLGPQVIGALNPANVKIGETDGALTGLIATQDTAAAKWETWKREVQEKFVNFMANTVIPFIDEKIMPGLGRIKAAFDRDGVGGALDEMKRLWEESWPTIETWLSETFIPGLVKVFTDNLDEFVKLGFEIGKSIVRGMQQAFNEAVVQNIPGAKQLLDFTSREGHILDDYNGKRVTIRPKADGGPVRAGQPYIVGEERPELFVPDQAGYILPEVPGGGNTYQLTTVTAKSDRTVTQEFALMELVAGFN